MNLQLIIVELEELLDTREVITGANIIKLNRIIQDLKELTTKLELVKDRSKIVLSVLDEPHKSHFKELINI